MSPPGVACRRPDTRIPPGQGAGPLQSTRVSHADPVDLVTSRAAVRPAHDAVTGDPRRHIAYLTNCYPKISHTFIRNEIAALERLGFDILRITIRPAPEALVDRDDIAEAARTWTLLRGGAARLILAAAARAIRRPVRFGAVLFDTLRHRPAGWLRSLAYFAEACALLQIARARGIGHVHVHFGTNPATVALIASRLGPLSFSMTVHGPDEFDAPVALDLRGKIAAARFVVAVSSFGRSQLMRWSAPGDWSKLHVVRCGVTDRFQVSPSADVAGLRSSRLVCVARLSAQKGLPLLIEAAAILAHTDAFCLRIVGDGELRPEIEAAIKARGLTGKVQLVGWASVEEVRRELLAARALVLPSFAEGLPVVLMEALALGRPVIATAIAGIPELVDAQTGWLVPAGSVDALVEAMRSALHSNVAALDAMATEGRARVRRAHDVDRNAGRLATLLLGCTGG